MDTNRTVSSRPERQILTNFLEGFLSLGCIYTIIMKLLPLTVLAAFLITRAHLCAAEAPKRSDAAVNEPAKTILENYLAIQTELAKDSIKGVNEHASAISKSATADKNKSLPANLGKQADAVAAAKDLKLAREAFKTLSTSVIQYVDDLKPEKGAYHEAYCPMAKASWLQKGQGIKNPYMGKEMLTCGTLKN